jgi:hypothetical protein
MIVQSGRKEGAPSPSSVIGLAIESISHIRAAENKETQKKRSCSDHGKNDQRAIQRNLEGTKSLICVGIETVSRNPFRRRPIYAKASAP